MCSNLHSSAHQSKYGWLPLAAWSCHVYSPGNASEDKNPKPKYCTKVLNRDDDNPALLELNEQNSSMSLLKSCTCGKTFHTYFEGVCPQLGSLEQVIKQARSSNSMYITAAYFVWMSFYNDHVLWVVCGNLHSSAHQSKYGWLPLAAWSCHVYSPGNASEDKNPKPKYCTKVLNRDDDNPALLELNEQNSSMSLLKSCTCGKTFHTYFEGVCPQLGSLEQVIKQARSSNSMYITAAYFVWMSFYDDPCSWVVCGNLHSSARHSKHGWLKFFCSLVLLCVIFSLSTTGK